MKCIVQLAINILLPLGGNITSLPTLEPTIYSISSLRLVKAYLLASRLSQLTSNAAAGKFSGTRQSLGHRLRNPCGESICLHYWWTCKPIVAYCLHIPRINVFLLADWMQWVNIQSKLKWNSCYVSKHWQFPATTTSIYDCIIISKSGLVLIQKFSKINSAKRNAVVTKSATYSRSDLSC